MARSKKSVSKGGGAGCLLLVALFWNGIVGVFDGLIVTSVVRSVGAQASWEPMEALVIESRVESHRGSDSTTYSPVVRYRYQVGPETLVSDRVSFFGWSTSDRGWADDMASQYPVGATVTGHYDPDEPSEAALEVSAHAIPPFAILFLLPFHVIGIGLLIAAVTAWRKRGDGEGDPVRERYVVVDRGGHVVIRRPSLGPRIAFGLTLLGTSFLSIFASLAFGGPGASWFVVLGFLAACVGLSAAAAVLAHRRRRRPDRHLHIDHRQGVFAFPADSDGAPIDRVGELELQSRETNVTINDVRQYDHRLVALVDGRPHDVFALRGAREDGDAVKGLIETEFIRALGEDQRSSAETV